MRFVLLSLLALAALAKDPYFFEKPYLQLGDRPALSSKEALELMWLGHDKDVDWAVEYQVGSSWKKAGVRMLRRVDFTGTAAHRVYAATLADLKPGATVPYRVMVSGKQVFESTALARKKSSDDSHFVVFGDCAAGTLSQKAIAFEVSKVKPDYIFITGDIVYSRGRVSEYQEKFWPVYNSDTAGPLDGAPLLRNTLLTGVIGNHDSPIEVDFSVTPDPFGYYLYWSQPMNGPALAVGEPNSPTLKGPANLRKKFLDTVGPGFPKMANFSFDYGTVHWTVLDADPYVDWTSPAFREWVRKDLKAASGAKWRIVAMHHPPFNSSKAHFREQRMRVLSDVFEEGKVTLALGGHVHNYQRTFPMKFAVQPDFVLGKNNEVPGKWKLDKKFDGAREAKPDGVIYIITGAGGANLYNPEQENDKKSWMEFTDKFISNTHSFTVIDADKKKLSIRQISETGKELDRFTIEH